MTPQVVSDNPALQGNLNFRQGAIMDGLNHRGHPRRSLWAVAYAAGTRWPS